ncbi:hypothetical protein N0Y54_29540 [Nostoc punctiforme UO1]|uniref:hypothetical protein n=1 Tax=Nostoc punctiforme TaxID=272131 RepID=UPI0030B4C42C
MVLIIEVLVLPGVTTGFLLIAGYYLPFLLLAARVSRLSSEIQAQTKTSSSTFDSHYAHNVSESFCFRAVRSPIKNRPF